MKEGNQMNALFKTFMFSSSYIPVLFMIFLNEMEALNYKSFVKVFEMNTIFWIVSLIVSILSTGAMWLWLRTMKKDALESSKLYKMENLKSYENEVLTYFVTFIIPIQTLKVNSYPSILMNIILISIVGIYFIKNNMLHFNPLLIILGYHIYSDDDENIIITRKDKYTIKNDNLEADQVGTSNIYYIL